MPAISHAGRHGGCAPRQRGAVYTVCARGGGDSAAVVEGAPPGIAAGVASLRPCMR